MHRGFLQKNVGLRATVTPELPTALMSAHKFPTFKRNPGVICGVSRQEGLQRYEKISLQWPKD